MLVLYPICYYNKKKQTPNGRQFLDNILPAYDDPLFSILIIIILVLIVSVSTLIFGNYKTQNREVALKQFLKGFTKSNTLLNLEAMPFEQKFIQPLSLLAIAFKNQGEYQKSINLNLYLIENISNFYKKEVFLEELGETYLKAGFLKRAKLIFLEILAKHPRNKKALKYLAIVLELLHEFDQALDTVEPLKILGEDTQKLEAHLKLSALLENKELSKEQKISSLISLLDNKSYSCRRIIKALFNLDPEIAWYHIKNLPIEKILDILWLLPQSKLNLDAITNHETLFTIYLAKGYLEANEEVLKSGILKSDIFCIETIIAAKKSGNDNVDLYFSYGCEKCKHHFPIGFERCPNCYAINSIQVKESLVEKRLTKGYSLL